MQRVANVGKITLGRTASNSLYGTVGSGIVTHIMLSSTKALCDADKLTLTYRDSKGAIPIFQAVPMTELAEMADLLGGSSKRSITGSQVVLPVGCFDVSEADAALDFFIEFEGNTSVNVEGASQTAAAAAGNFAITIIQNETGVQKVLSYIPATGSFISKDFKMLFIRNAASYLNETVEIVFKGDRSNIVTVQEFLSLSNARLNQEKNNTNVALCYVNPSAIPEVEEVRVSNTGIKFYFVQEDYNEAKVTTVIQKQTTATIANAISLKKENPAKFIALQKASPAISAKVKPYSIVQSQR